MPGGYLLVADGEFALRLFVLVGKGLQLLDGLALQHRDAELYVGLCVLVAGLYVGGWDRRVSIYLV